MSSLLLSLTLIAALPKDFQGYTLGMDQASFVAKGKEALAREPSLDHSVVCEVLKPGEDPISEDKLAAEVSVDEEGLVLRYRTPQAKSLNSCSFKTADYAIEGRFVDDALVFLRVDFERLSQSDILFLATEKYGVPARIRHMRTEWLSPSAQEGWQQQTSNVLDDETRPTYHWHDSAVDVVFIQHQLTLVARGLKWISEEHLPDAAALHKAELLKNHKF